MSQVADHCWSLTPLPYHEVTRSISTSPPLLDGMLVHHRVTPSIKFAGIRLYTWVKRGTVRVKCPAQEYNAVPWPRLKPGPLDLESNALTIRPPRSHISNLRAWTKYYIAVCLHSYLNTHLKKQKQDYGEISPYTTSFCPDVMEEVMDIGAVS